MWSTHEATYLRQGGELGNISSNGYVHDVSVVNTIKEGRMMQANSRHSMDQSKQEALISRIEGPTASRVQSRVVHCEIQAQ